MSQNKIIVGYEKYDMATTKGWNFNGRHTTNHLLREFSPMNLWLDDIYKVIISPSEFPESYVLHEPLFGHQGPEHINLPRHLIPSRLKYFYPILIINMGLYLRYTTSIEISSEVRQDVLDGRAYIIFVYGSEGDLRYGYERMCELILAMNLPKERIIFFHGDHDTDYFKNAPFVYKPVSQFNHWLTFNRGDVKPVAYSPEKLFLCFNRTVRTHKQMMICSLIKHELLDNGIVSCGTLFPVEELLNHYRYELSETQIQKLRNIEMTSPDNAIQDNIFLNQVDTSRNREYETTFLSLVTETLMDGSFISEKSFKPILAGHPFIILSAVNHLKLLRKLGYRTFGDYWNEDYDDETDLVKKIEKISEILTKLNSLSKEQLFEMRRSMNDIIVHNQRVFVESVKKGPYGQMVYVKNELKEML